MSETGASVNRWLRFLRRPVDRPLLDLVDERNVAECLYGRRTVQASPVNPPVLPVESSVFGSVRIHDECQRPAAEALVVIAELAALPSNKNEGDAG